MKTDPNLGAGEFLVQLGKFKLKIPWANGFKIQMFFLILKDKPPRCTKQQSLSNYND